MNFTYYVYYTKPGDPHEFMFISIDPDVPQSVSSLLRMFPDVTPVRVEAV